MEKRAHKITSIVGFILIISFQISTVVSEALQDYDMIATVKRLILYGIFVLIPVMLIANTTGRSLAGRAKHPIILKKMQRMKFIGFNAFVILIPSAIVLYQFSRVGYWGNWFIAVQILELIAGIMNVALMGINIRDGIKLRRLRNKA